MGRGKAKAPGKVWEPVIVNGRQFSFSVSEIEAFLSCPAKYKYSQEWKSAKITQELQDGADAHALIANQPLDHTPSRRAVRFAARLKHLESGYRMYDDWREKYQVVEWRGMLIRRIIDAGASLKRIGRLIDYKTGTWEWREVEGIIPQALTFQGVAYLIPPSKREDFGPFKRGWPTQLDFFSAPENGAAEIIPYHYEPEDEENLYEAAMQLAETKRFPKHRGYGCAMGKDAICPFFHACYGLVDPAKSDLYKARP